MKKKYRLKLKNFWRRNEKLILMIMVSFVLGAALAGLNYYQHQQAQIQFELNESIEITSNEPATFEFPIDQPDLTPQATLETVFENVTQDSAVEVYVNGEQVSTVSSETGFVQIEGDLLQAENEVEIQSTEIVSEGLKITGATVTATTRFRDLIFVLLNFGAILLMAAPIMWVKYNQFQRRKEMEEKFPEFLRDILEGTRAGMSLPQAIQNSETGSYGALNEKVNKLSAQLDWGIPFEDALQNFSQETQSGVIQQSVDTIIQAYSSGGDIEDVLESVGDNIRTIKQLKEQRESQLYSEMITGYIVYFIFIGILIGLTNFLLPNLAQAQSSLSGGGQFNPLGMSGGNLEENISLYETWFSRLVYIQALFSGLIIGKLAEGELKAGFKHMAILFAVGYLAITFFL